MFRLATCDLMGRRVLLVEDDEQTQSVVTASIAASGGSVVGYAGTLPQAVNIASHHEIDLVLLHIRHVPEHKGPIRELFAPRGIAVEFLACFDDWFDIEEDVGDPIITQA